MLHLDSITLDSLTLYNITLNEQREWMGYDAGARMIRDEPEGMRFVDGVWEGGILRLQL